MIYGGYGYDGLYDGIGLYEPYGYGYGAYPYGYGYGCGRGRRCGYHGGCRGRRCW